MFKQLQENQRRQRLQELGDARNQNYINQLTSFKHASAGQLVDRVNGTPIFDSSQTFMVGNMNMMQHAGSDFLQELPNKLVHSHSQNHVISPVCLSHLQFDMPLHESPMLNTDANLSFKMDNVSLGMASMHRPIFGDSFMNRQCDFLSDVTSMSDGSFLPSQLFQENNFFEQDAIQNYAKEVLPENYCDQGNTFPRTAFTLESEGQHEDANWDIHSPGKSSKLGLFPLDPPEQKILFSTDDNVWESSLSRSGNMHKGGFVVENTSFIDALPSSQRGSWSALVQSAVAETSSSDTGIQEEWSGLSFQNPEQSSDYMPSNLFDSQNQQSNWVDKSLQNMSSPSSKTENLLPNPDRNFSFSSFQPSGLQSLRQDNDFNLESSCTSNQHSTIYSRQLADYNSQLENLTGISNVIPPSVVLSNILGHQPKDHLKNDEHQTLILSCSIDNQANDNLSGQDLRGSSWLHGSTVYDGFMGNVSDQFNSQHPAPPVPSHILTKFLADNVSISQENSHVGFHGLPPSPWPDTTTQQKLSSPNTCELSSNLFQCNDLVLNSLETSMGVPDDQLNQQSFERQYNVHESVRSSGRFRDHEQKLEGSFVHEGSVEITNSPSSTKSTCVEDILRKHCIPADDVTCISLLPRSHYQTTVGVPAGDMRAHVHTLNEKYSKLYSVHSPINAEINNDSTFPIDCGNINNLQAISNSRELLLNEHKSGDKNRTKVFLNVISQLGASSTGDLMGQNSLQEVRGNQSGLADHQTFAQMEMLQQNDIQKHFCGNDESNLSYGSQFSLHMTPTWFKHHGTFRNEQVFPICDPNAAVNEVKPFTGLTFGNAHEDILIGKENLISHSQGSGVWPSATATLIAEKKLMSPSLLLSGVAHQNLDVSISKKRKIIFDMVPWHNIVSHESAGVQNIRVSGTAEIEWPQTSNRKLELKNEGQSVEDLHPVFRAKRRLVLTTHLMEKLFGPVPADFLYEYASSNCYCIVYSIARLALGDAFSLTGKIIPNTNVIMFSSPEMKMTSKSTDAYDFSKAVEGLQIRVNKIEGDLSRMDKTLFVSDIKVENQELEKISLINRFAKFYIMAQSSAIGAATSSNVQKLKPQRYVMPLPMPRTIPECIDCLSL